MPELANRDEYERRLLRELGKASADITTLVIDALGFPPDATRITVDLMAEVNARYGRIMAEELTRVFIDAARGMSAVNVPFDMSVIEEAADDWSARYVPTRLRDMEQTTTRRLRNVITTTLTLGLLAEAYRERVARVFGRERMENVAVTEVTFAHMDAERAVARQIQGEGGVLVGESGIRLIPIWQTANDDIVCPICSPRNQSRITDGVFPPAHPRCRCWASWEPES